MCKEEILFHYLDSGIQTDSAGDKKKQIRLLNQEKQKLKQKKARHKS